MLIPNRHRTDVESPHDLATSYGIPHSMGDVTVSGNGTELVWHGPGEGAKPHTPSTPMTTYPPTARVPLAILAGAVLWGLTPSTHADSAFLGVAAGDASSDAAVLWTRPAGTPTVPIPLTAQVSTDPLDFSAALTFAATADLSTDYTAKVVASGLAAGTRYYYRFTDGNNLSAIGTFKTAPSATDSVGVRFAFSGDMDGLMRPYPLASQVPGQNLDFYVNLGDVIYENASASLGNNAAPWLVSPSVTLSGSSASLNGVPVAGTAFATQVQLFNDYSKKYREQFLPVNTGGQDGLATFYAGQGNYTLNDNHELGNRQYINGGAPAGGSVGGPLGSDMPTGRGVDARANGTGNVGNVNDAADLLALSPADFMNHALGFKTLQQVYFNYQPILETRATSSTLPGDNRTDGTRQLFFSQPWGSHAVYIQTDTRSYRDIRLKTATGSADDTGSRADNGSRTYFGKTQLAWLEQALLAAEQAGTQWKFVSMSDPIDQIGPIGGALAGTLTGVNSDGGKSMVGGYRAERNALLAFIADNNIRNVVFLATDDHQNRINEVTYAPSGITGPGSPGGSALTAAAIQGGYVKVPYCFSIVCGPLGATGPDTVTDHSFANIKAIADSVAAAEVAAGVEPIGLAGYPGLHDVVREGDANAGSAPSAVDFYSPDTFNFNVLEVSPDGTTLTVSSVGINSTPVNSALEYDPVNNPARTIFSFKVTAAAAPRMTLCPGDITLGTDAGLCSAFRSFAAEASGFPAPTLTYTLNGNIPVTSPFVFPKGVSLITCTASSPLGTDSCSFTVTVKDTEAPVASVSQSIVSGDTFTTLKATDNCDGTALRIFVKDSAQGACGGSFVAGPYPYGTVVRLQRASKASVGKGSDGAKAVIKTVGNPILVITDAAGNTSCTTVLVPRS